jgi:hypothetical protein
MQIYSKPLMYIKKLRSRNRTPLECWWNFVVEALASGFCSWHLKRQILFVKVTDTGINWLKFRRVLMCTSLIGLLPCNTILLIIWSKHSTKYNGSMVHQIYFSIGTLSTTKPAKVGCLSWRYGGSSTVDLSCTLPVEHIAMDHIRLLKDHVQV